MCFTPIENTAYHEAGHAVANVALGRQIARLSIIPEGELYGVCSRVPMSDELLNLENEIVSLLSAKFSEELHGPPLPAGIQGDEKVAKPIAVRLLKQRGEWEEELTNDEIDAINAPFLERQRRRSENNEAIDRNNEKIDENLFALKEKARLLIRKHELAVHRVAAELLDKRELIGSEAHNFVENAVLEAENSGE